MVPSAILTTLGEIAAASAVEALVVPSTVTRAPPLAGATSAARWQGQGIAKGKATGGCRGRGHPGRRAGGQGDRTVRASRRLTRLTREVQSLPRILQHPGRRA